MNRVIAYLLDILHTPMKPPKREAQDVAKRDALQAIQEMRQASKELTSAAQRIAEATGNGRR